MFSLRDLCFVLCSIEADILRAQRIIGFFILITRINQRGPKIRSQGSDQRGADMP